MKTTKLIALFLFAGMLVASCGNNAQNQMEEHANNEATIQAEAKQRAEEARIEAEKKAKEEQERATKAFIGTYTIRNCKINNVETTHVPKTKFTYEQDVSTYHGYTIWDFEIVVRNDLSVFTREVNIREYDEYDRLVSTKDSKNSLEAGNLYIISDHLFTIESRSDFEIVKYAPYRFYRTDGTIDDHESGFSLRTNHLVVDISSNRIYRELLDYQRKDEREGYDWVGYGCATFSKK